MNPLKSIFFSGICSICLLTHLGCHSGKHKEVFPDSERYNFSNPLIINLPVSLDEISGIAYYAKDTSLFAIVDEDGILFKIPINHPAKTKKWVFDKPRDYEDIVLKDSVFYALVSNGNIIKIKFNADSISTEKIEFSDSPDKKENEFESLYLDSGRIIMMCKQCKEDKKKKLSTYILNDSETRFQPYMQVDVLPIEEKDELKKEKLKPSAAAINPLTHELYIISSINRILVVLNSKGELQELYKLNPKIYKQAEGIAFTPWGDLIISNEVFLEGHATLLILKNKKK
jgi:hypothetical protein